MKSYVKGIITGILIGSVIVSVPVVAENIDVLFNNVRININGVDCVQWDEEIKLGDGTSAPSSILYSGTTYLPIRKISELTGNKVYWNGDSKTVSVTNGQQNVTTIAEKPDDYGNMWKYYTFCTEELRNPSYTGNRMEYYYYLGVSDEVRGYERVYRILNTAVSVTDNEIYFIRLHDEDLNSYYSLVTLKFDNNENTQDGEEKRLGSRGDILSAGFDGEWLFIAGKTSDNGSRAMIQAYHCVTGETVTFIDFDNRWTNASNLKVISNGNTSVIQFDYGTTGQTLHKEITFDKTTNTFGDMRTME